MERTGIEPATPSLQILSNGPLPSSESAIRTVGQATSAIRARLSNNRTTSHSQGSFAPNLPQSEAVALALREAWPTLNEVERSAVLAMLSSALSRANREGGAS